LKNTKGYFHIISKDTGYDLLIKHLKEKKILINRYAHLEDIPALKQSGCEFLSINEKINIVVNYLIKRGNAKPRKVETLSNTINSLCSRRLNKEEINNIILTMSKNKYITIDNEKIIYTLKNKS